MAFIDDGATELGTTKRDRLAAPATVNSDYTIDADDWNGTARAVNETRTYLRSSVVKTVAPRLVPDDPDSGTENADQLGALIEDLSGTGAVIELPAGSFYIDAPTSGTNGWIRFGPGITDVSIRGRGANDTILIQQGDGDGGDTSLIEFDRAIRCRVSRLKVMTGIIKRPDPIQLNHLINIVNGSTDASGTTDEITIEDIVFGKCIGDQLRFFGNTTPITNIRADRLVLHGFGGCIQNWAANTAYVVGEWVRNDSGKNYICTVAGASASSGGPTGTAVSGITDGSATWGYKAPRNAARSGISFQRGYSRVEVSNFFIDGVQNSPLDQEPTGSGTMEYANVHHGFIDNSLGATSYGASYSGVSAGSRTSRNRLADITILNGALSIISTEDLLVERVKSICTAAFAADTTTPNILIRQRNDNLQIRDVTVERSGTAVAAALIDVENPVGSGFTLDGFNAKQGTNAQTILIADCTRPIVRRGKINFTAGTPAGKQGIAISAINSNCNNPIVDDVMVETASGKLEAAVAFVTRSGQPMTNISAARIKSSGHASYGVLLSKGDGTTYDTQPLISDVNNGTDLAIRCENQANVAIDTIFPVISGSIGDTSGIRTMQGTVAPSGVVTATPGCMYIYINGDSTHLYFKATGTGNTGWTQVV